MRESRTYGSVRGACDETHVPTATLRTGLAADPGHKPASIVRALAAPGPMQAIASFAPRWRARRSKSQGARGLPFVHRSSQVLLIAIVPKTARASSLIWTCSTLI